MSQFPVEDKVILASAGSGKTFALSDRIVKLLATGAKPEQIVALTFTRAAAAEFVARTLEKLAKAASSEEEAADLRSENRLNLPSTCDAASSSVSDCLNSFSAESVGNCVRAVASASA